MRWLALVLVAIPTVAVGSALAHPRLTRTPVAIARCFRQRGVKVEVGANVQGIFPKSVAHTGVLVVTFKDLRRVAFAGGPGLPEFRLQQHPTGLVVVNQSRATNVRSQAAFLQWLHNTGATPTAVLTAAQAHLESYGTAWVQWNPPPLARSKDHHVVLACLGRVRT